MFATFHAHHRSVFSGSCALYNATTVPAAARRQNWDENHPARARLRCALLRRATDRGHSKTHRITALPDRAIA